MRPMLRMRSTILTMTLIFSSFCHAESTTMTNNVVPGLSSVPPAVWQKLAAKKIYFGHQSVGDNIVTGLREVLAKHPEITLRIQERAELATPAGPSFVHSYVGTNEQPLSKNEAFANALRGKLRKNVDVAFFKYCYVDVTESRDVVRLFQDYKQTMDDLKRQNPQVMFVHVTAPLTTIQTGWKASVKKMLGKPLGGYADNVKRNQFNDLIRKEYAEKEPLLDLAKFEATRMDGSQATFEYQGRKYLSLAPEYTDDGGHLNEVGRKYIAEQLLIFLAEQVARGHV
jgi:hypothetical protein